MAFIPYDKATDLQRKSIISSSSPISKDNPNGAPANSFVPFGQTPINNPQPITAPTKGFVPYENSQEKKSADKKILDAVSKITPQTIFDDINKKAGVPSPVFNTTPDVMTSAEIPAVNPAAPAPQQSIEDMFAQYKSKPSNFQPVIPPVQQLITPQAQQPIDNIMAQYKPKPSTFGQQPAQNTDLLSQYQAYLEKEIPEYKTWVPDWMQVGPIKSAIQKGSTDIQKQKEEDLQHFQALTPEEQQTYMNGLNGGPTGDDWMAINNKLGQMYDSHANDPVSWGDKFSGAYTKAMMGQDTTENQASNRTTGNKFEDTAANVLGNIAGFIGPGAEGSIMTAADHAGTLVAGKLAPLLSKLPANAPLWLKNILMTGAKGAATFGTMNAIQAGETAKTPGEAAKTIGEGATIGVIAGPLAEILPPSFTEALEKSVAGRTVLRGIPGAATFGTMSASDVMKQYDLQKEQEKQINAALQAGQISPEQYQEYMSQVNRVTPGQAVSSILAGMATGFIIDNAMHVMNTNPAEYLKTKRFDADIKKFYSQVDSQYQEAQNSGTVEGKQYIYDKILSNIDAAKSAYDSNANKYPASSQDNFNQAMDFLKVWISNEKRMSAYGVGKTTFIPAETAEPISNSPAGENTPSQEAAPPAGEEPVISPAGEKVVEQVPESAPAPTVETAPEKYKPGDVFNVDKFGRLEVENVKDNTITFKNQRGGTTILNKSIFENKFNPVRVVDSSESNTQMEQTPNSSIVNTLPNEKQTLKNDSGASAKIEPKTYDEYQTAIDNFTDTLAKKYGEVEALHAPILTRTGAFSDLNGINLETGQPSKISADELKQLQELYAGRDAIHNSERQDNIDKVVNGMTFVEPGDEWVANKNTVTGVLSELQKGNELDNIFGEAKSKSAEDLKKTLYNKLIQTTGAPSELWGEYDYAKNIADGKTASPYGKSLKPLFKQIDDIVNNMVSSGSESMDNKTISGKIESKDQTPALKIANAVKTLLHEGKSFNAIKLHQIATEAYQGKQSEGKWVAKDATDAMELGVNLYLLEQKSMNLAAKDLETVKTNYDKLTELVNKLPTQTKRTEEMNEFQQFSTPPNIAYLATWAADITKNDTVLEPSAGPGGLAVFAKAEGAKVIANELSEKRFEVLKLMGFDKVYNEDAEQIDNILPAYIKITAVTMNPPFSSTAGRMEGKRDTRFATRHIEQALNRLEDGGRLVTIVGRGMADNTPMFRDYWEKLKKTYNIRANIGIAGKNYNKYGTSFDIQLIIIDKTGSTPKTETQPGKFKYDTITGNYENPKDIIDVLEDVVNDRKEIATQPNRTDEQATTQSDSQELPQKVEPTAGPDTNILPAVDNVRTEKPESGSERTPGNQATNEGSSRPAANVGEPSGGGQLDNLQTKPNGVVEGAAKGEVTPGSGSNVDRGIENKPGGKEPSSVKVEVKEDKNVLDREKQGDSVYSDYVPQKLKIPGAKPHPGQLAQSAAMAAVEPPDPTYTPKLDKSIITEGKLSIAQLESVVYAGQAHDQILPDGTRKAFFIGDGTGVGKGREISGIIMDNWNRGRKKAIWVSKNEPLFVDAQRDYSALGGNVDNVFSLAKTKLDDTIKPKQGIMFTTYGTITQNLSASVNGDVKTKPDRKSRLDQIADWVGKDFDGVLIFDESHKMQNAMTMKGSRGMKKGSLTALAGIDLQKKLPKARIVYASATGATEVENLAYAERLGLWGKGTSFNDKEDFMNKIKAGGLAAMEFVARDMKAMGVYIARTLSFDGIHYETLEHKLTPEQTQIYDALSEGWQNVLQNLNDALEITGQAKDGNAKGRAVGQFWGANQRFYNQILTSMQMPTVISNMKDQLQKGNACVLQLVNTNEATQNRALEGIDEDSSLEDLDLTPRDMLMMYLDKSFPTQQFEDYTDENGNERSRPVVDKEGNRVVNRQAERMKDALMEKIGSMKVPDGPLEIILNTFGPENVAEVTGRSRRVVKVKKEGTKELKAVIENRSSRHVAAEVKDFQDDERQILVFSEAGGTGKSYHADKTAKNQRQRIHYLVQAGWSAPPAVQGLGRTNRTNQASKPVYALITTNLKGQKRFISSIARRLDQLGALTKGQRQTGSQGLFSAKDNLESAIAKDALARFYKDLAKDKIPGLDKRETLTQMGLDAKLLTEDGTITEDQDELRNITKFLNRILSLDTSLQNKVFDAFSERLDDMVETAIANGTLDMGLENIKADKIKLVEQNVIRTDESGAKTSYVQLEASHRNHPTEFADLDTTSSRFVGFYTNNVSHNIRAIYTGRQKTLENGSIVDTYKVSGPMTNDSIELKKFSENWTEVKKKEAESLWNEAMTKVPEYRTEKLNLISGALLPIWNRLPDTHVRVVRVITDKGQDFLGRLVPEREIDSTLRRLDAERKREAVDYKSLAKQIFEDNYTVYLSNDWKIARSRVAGEYRIEIIGNNLYTANQDLKNDGVFTEIIKPSYSTRYFIPTGDKIATVLEAITKYRPIAEILPPGESKTSESGKGFHGSTAGVRIEPGRRTEGKAKPISQIIRELQIGFKVPVSTKRFMKKKYDGYYEIHPELVVNRWDNDLQTVAHEIGHHLDKLYNFTKLYDELRNRAVAVNRVLSLFKNKPGVNMDKWKSEQKRIELEMQQSPIQEMIDNLPQIFHDSYEKKDLSHEAIAEFVKRYMVNQSEAQLFGSKFYRTFESTVSKDYMKLLDKASDDISKWYSQDIRDKMKGTMQSYTKTDGINFGYMKRRIEQSLFDEFNSFKEFTDMAVANNGGKALSADKNPHIMALNTKGSLMQAYAVIKESLIDPEGNKIGDSFKSLMSKIPDKLWDDYNAYLKGKHALDWWDIGKKVFPVDISIDDIKNQVSAYEAEHPEFIESADALYSWWHKFIKSWLVDTGLLDGEVHKAMIKKYPHYVPLFRVMDKYLSPDNVNNSRKAKKGFSDITAGIKRASKHGSTKDTHHPVEEFVNEIYRIVQTVKRREVLLTIHNLYDSIEGMGFYLRRLPTKVNTDRFDARDIKSQVIVTIAQKHIDQLSQDEHDKFNKMSLQDQANFVLDQGWEESADIVDNLIDDVIKKFIPEKQSKENDVIGVIDKAGNYIQYEVFDPLFLESLLSLGKHELPGIMKVFAAVTRLRKTLITGSNPFFGTISNMPRDFMRSLTMGSIKNPFQFVYEYVDSIMDVIKKSDDFKQLRASGGGNVSKFSTTRDMHNELLDEIVPGRKWRHPINIGSKTVKVFNPVSPVIETIEAYNDLIETLSRLPEWKSHDRSTYAGRMEALYQFNDITTNFNKRGSASYSIDPILMFYNAGMQGLNKIWRAASRADIKDKKDFWSRLIRNLAYITVPLVLTMILYRNDPEYQRMSNYMKDSFFIYRNPLYLIRDKLPEGFKHFGDAPFNRIPLDKELGVLFGSLVRRSYNAIVNKDPHAFKDFDETVINNMLPPVNPITDSLIGPIIDVERNKNWLGKPIISKALEFLEGHPEMQYDDTTSDIAKRFAALAAFIPGADMLKSPKKVDYLLTQYGGVIAQILQPATTQSKGWTSILDGLAKKISVDPAYSTDIMNDFYANRDEITGDRQKAMMLGHKALPKELEAIYTAYNHYATDFSKYNKAIRLYEEDTSIDPEEKAQKIRTVKVGMLLVADKFDRYYDSYKASEEYKKLKDASFTDIRSEEEQISNNAKSHK